MDELTQAQRDAWQAAMFVQDYYSQSLPPELLNPEPEVAVPPAPKRATAAKKATT